MFRFCAYVHAISQEHGRHDLERSLLQVLFIAAAYILLFKNKESASFHNKETVCKSMPHNDSRLRRDFSFAFLLDYIPTGMATTLHFCYPAMVIVFSIVFLREKVRPLKLLCVAMCLAGMFMFYDVGGNISLTGIFLAFVSGNTYAFYILYLDKSELKEIHSLKLILYMNTVAAVLIGSVALATGQMILPFPAAGWAAATAFAVCVSFIAVLGFQIGVKYTGGQSAAILSTLEPITSVMVGITVYGESFSAKGVAGCVLILAATVIVAMIKEDGVKEPCSDQV